MVAGVLLLPSMCISTEAATYSVNKDGLGDFTAIQPAIAAADDGDTIIVDEGTYLENINFLGKAVVLRSTDPNDTSLAVRSASL